MKRQRLAFVCDSFPLPNSNGGPMDGEDCLLVKTGSEFTRCIEHLMKNPAYLRSMSNAARKTYEKANRPIVVWDILDSSLGERSE